MAKQAEHGCVIVGTGFAGLGMAAGLIRQLDYRDFILVERNKSVGGVWASPKHTGYPGQACDIPAIFYSFSWKQQYWTDVWARQQAIHDYVLSVVADYQLDDHIKLETSVNTATWNESAKYWDLTMTDGKTGKAYKTTAKVFVNAVGTFNEPNEFKPKGLDTFTGRIIHSGKWDPTLDLAGKNVVLLGNGCSAVQIASEIAPTVKNLTQFIRTKHWILPRREPPPGLQKLLRKYALARRLFRIMIFFVTEADHRMLNWETGTPIREKYMAMSKKFISEEAPAEYREILTPNFTLGTKRRIFDTGYVKALHNPNFQLFEEDVAALDENGIVRQNGERVQADIIILATGFQVQKVFFPMTITGRNSEDLQEHIIFDKGLQGFLGLFYSNFPNFAGIMSLNTGQGHSSVIFTVEAAVNLAIKTFAPVLRQQADAVDLKRDVERTYFQWLRKHLSQTIWERKQGTTSWYVDAQGRSTVMFPANQITYWWKCVTTRGNKFNYDNDRRSIFSGSFFSITSVLALCLSVLLYTGRLGRVSELFALVRSKLKVA